ncbi:1107_t:CDS:2 [Funneliformis geosporum]|uniref:10809_t:CDS:1 n=1 Tax=Funneliformis geosporum TaxID=1117311 RepID=A0A9W4SYS4_9GLOM|nr:10809_t:CDS:2 [Funneliformis geosporum]CAI2194065.1 1107_t:CDS:2 [Funneliformis geosporum]
MKDEGELTMMKAKLVYKQTLADFALGLKLETKLKLGKDQNFLELIEFMKSLLE